MLLLEVRHKTDKVDSRIIAEYASKNDLQELSPKDKAHQELQDLYRCLQNLKGQKKQTDNYLEHKEHLPKSVCNSYKSVAKHITKQMKIIESKIDNLITNHTVIKQQINNIFLV